MSKQKIKILLLSLLATFIVILTIGFLGSDNFKSPVYHEIVQLESGWTVQLASQTYTPDILSEISLPILNDQDTITLTSILPDSDLDSAVLHFRSILSTVDVYIDGTLIYSYGHDYLSAGKMLPKFHHFVSLPMDFSGRTVTIVITATENNAFSGLSPVVLGNEEELARAVAQDGRLSLAIGVFLVMFGFVLAVLSPFLVFTESHDYSITFSGLLSVLLGFYILCFNDLFWLFSDSPGAYTFIEYFSLFCIPAAILGFLHTSGYINVNLVTRIIWILNVSFVVITSLLHAFNIVHICHFVTFLHIIAIIEGLYIIVTLIINTVKRRKEKDALSTGNISTNMLIVGLLLFLVCSVTDIVKFNVLKFLENGEVNTDISFMTVGALIFILSLLLNYFFHCIESISASNVKERLEGLAYTDSLTKLSNRTKCELTMAELKGDYTIISIDLDYLKYTNDNFGHSEGDRLLTGFADILHTSFTDALLVGRMGGDEFIVILPYVDKDRTKRDLECMKDLMRYRTTLEKHIKYSASYGYADSQDKELESNTTQNVYLLADSRMYQMKNTHHKQTLGRLYEDLMKDFSQQKGENKK